MKFTVTDISTLVILNCNCYLSLLYLRLLHVITIFTFDCHALQPFAIDCAASKLDVANG